MPVFDVFDLRVDTNCLSNFVWCVNYGKPTPDEYLKYAFMRIALHAPLIPLFGSNLINQLWLENITSCVLKIISQNLLLLTGFDLMVFFFSLNLCSFIFLFCHLMLVNCCCCCCCCCLLQVQPTSRCTPPLHWTVYILRILLGYRRLSATGDYRLSLILKC